MLYSAQTFSLSNISQCINQTDCDECYPVNPILSLTAGLLCILIGMFGACGNLLTLLAIPWAQRNKILGFDQPPSKYTRIFILNLAFADFAYCVLILPMYSVTYLRSKCLDSGGPICSSFAALHYLIAFAAWMALAFVPFSWYLSLRYPKLTKKASEKHINLIIVGGIWVYALAMVIPTIAGRYGTFEYSPESGKCDYLAEGDHVDPRYFLYSVGFGLPFVLILYSNIGMWKLMTDSSRCMKPYAILETRKLIRSRERRMVWTLIGMTFCYVLFVSPIMICMVYGGHGDTKLSCFILYWFQYSLNFVVYAASNPEFRAAYLAYLKNKLSIYFGTDEPCRDEVVFVVNTMTPIETYIIAFVGIQ